MLKPDNEQRKVEIEEPQKTNIIITKKHEEIILRFNNSIEYITNQLDVNVNDDQFLFKSCIVLAVSSLDFYIHEIVKYKILIIFDGRAPKTKSYNNFILSLSTVEKAIKSPESLDWLNEEIKHRNSYKSFQRSEKIAEAISIINDANIWKALADKLSEENTKIKTELDEIIKVRDDISHQDSAETTMLERQFISNSINFIQKIVKEIHCIVLSECTE